MQEREQGQELGLGRAQMQPQARGHGRQPVQVQEVQEVQPQEREQVARVRRVQVRRVQVPRRDCQTQTDP